MFWADLSTTLRDVTHAEAMLFLGALFTIAEHIQWVHIELCDADKEARPCKGLLILFVITDYVAGILAQETFDALAEFL